MDKRTFKNLKCSKVSTLKTTKAKRTIFIIFFAWLIFYDSMKNKVKVMDKRLLPNIFY